MILRLDKNILPQVVMSSGKGIAAAAVLSEFYEGGMIIDGMLDVRGVASFLSGFGAAFPAQMGSMGNGR